MASRLILNHVKAPIRFILRNPVSSIPSKPTASSAIPNLLVPSQYSQSNAGDFSKPRVIGGGYGSGLMELGLNDIQLPIGLKFALDGGFRIEASKNRHLIEREFDFVDDDDDDDDDDSDCYDYSCSDDDYDDDERD